MLWVPLLVRACRGCNQSMFLSHTEVSLSLSLSHSHTHQQTFSGEEFLESDTNSREKHFQGREWAMQRPLGRRSYFGCSSVKMRSQIEAGQGRTTWKMLGIGEAFRFIPGL